MENKRKTIHPFISHLISGFVGGLLVLGIFSQAIPGFFPNKNQNVNQPEEQTFSGKTTVLDVSDVVEKINPAVVSIVITKDVPVMEEYYDDPFSQFFGEQSPFHFRIPRYRQNGTEEKEIGGGSGFLVSEDGYVVTNGHVVSDEEAQYTVFTNDGTKFEAKVIAIDDVLDVALLKIEATSIPFLIFGDSSTLRLGESVIAIGNALGEFSNTVSTGVVSGLSRSIVAGNGYGMQETLENVIQTDAAINPGN